MSGEGSIVRVDMGAGGWAAVPRNVFNNDSGLSLAARGLLGWFLTRPDGWQVRVAWCMEHHGLGDKGWSSLANELAAAGYYHREKKQDERGRLRTAVTITPTPTPPLGGVGATDPSFTEGRCGRGPVQPGIGEGGVLKERVKEKEKQQQPVVVFSADLLERGLLSNAEQKQLESSLSLLNDPEEGQALADEIAGALRARGRTGERGIKNPILFVRALMQASSLTYASGERALREARARVARRAQALEPQHQGAPVPAAARELMERLRRESRGEGR